MKNRIKKNEFGVPHNFAMLFYEVHAKARKVRAHVYVLGVSKLPFFKIFLLNFGIVPTKCYFFSI